MGVGYYKPSGLKYTDMCIYIDKHLSEIKIPNENPDIESTVFKYLYCIVYALSYKSGFFMKMEDYDYFSCYAATELLIAMRKKLINEGKEVKGKVITPVKSCLNFIKATLFPLKVTYQRCNFETILDPRVHEDTSELQYDMKEAIQSQYRPDLLDTYLELIDNIPKYINRTLDSTPFRNDKLMRKKLYLSTILTFLSDITIPNKLQTRIEKYMNNDTLEKSTKKFINAYKLNSDEVVLYHLPDSYKSYVRFLVVKIKKLFNEDFEEYLHGDDLSDALLDNIMETAYTTYENNEEA